MELCLVVTPDDALEGTDSSLLNHAHLALVGEDPSGTLEAGFNKLDVVVKRQIVQSLIRQHCNLTGEDFAIIDLPEDAQKEFVVGLMGKKKSKTTKRSDTPDIEAKPEGKQTRKIKSETDPDTTYEVTIENGQATHCQCVGFRYYKTCKHVDAVQRDLDNPW